MFENLTGLLAVVPVWVGPLVIAVTFVLFRFVFSAILRGFGGDAGRMLGGLTEQLAWLPAVFVLVAWVVALVGGARRRRLFDRQTGLGTIRQLTWREFEALIGEAFRRKGYSVVETGRAAPDGGVDLVLSKDGEETIVQCKRWKEWQVGVEKVRELYGIMASRGSTGGILVTCGKFSQAACQFAEGKSMELINGPRLAQLIAGIQVKTGPAIVKVANDPADSVACPLCGSAMILRTAKKGPQPGSKFWGCAQYPACSGKRAAQHLA